GFSSESWRVEWRSCCCVESRNGPHCNSERWWRVHSNSSFFQWVDWFKTNAWAYTCRAKWLSWMARSEYSFCTDKICPRSEEHTSELQSRFDLVCRLLLEK